MKIKYTVNIEGIIDVEKKMTKEYYDELLKMTKEEQYDFLSDWVYEDVKDHATEDYQVEIIDG